MTGPGHRDRYAAAVLEAERRELENIVGNICSSYITLESIEGVDAVRTLSEAIARAVIESGWPNGPVRPDPVSEDDLWRGYGLASRIAARGGVDR